MQERRSDIRVETPVLIEFPNPKSKKLERSFTSDVSESGLRFPTAVRFRVGDRIPVSLSLPLTDRIMPANATVMWVREVANYALPQYEVGVRFQWVQDPDQVRFIRHLNALLGVAGE